MAPRPERLCMKPIRKYLSKESVSMRKEKLKQNEWFELWSIPEVPKQNNHDDCGVFVSAAVEHILAGKPLTYTQQDIPRLRQHIVYTIIREGISGSMKQSAV